MEKDVRVNVFEAQSMTDHELALEELRFESDGMNVVLHTAIHGGVRYVTNGMHFSGIPLSYFKWYEEI